MPGTVPNAVVQAMLAAFHARQLAQQQFLLQQAGIPVAIPMPQQQQRTKQAAPVKKQAPSSSDDAEGGNDQGVSHSGSEDEEMHGRGSEGNNQRGSRRGTRSSTPPGMAPALALRYAS